MFYRKRFLPRNALPATRNANSWMFPAISPIAGSQERIRGSDDFHKADVRADRR
jgi:hypothetical protein